MDFFERYRRDRAFAIAEVSERQRERLLEALGRQGDQAADLLQSAWHIASTVDDIAVEVSRMAAVADWTLPAIVEHLALTADHLGGLEQMVSRPEETKAAEQYRNGARALSMATALAGNGSDELASDWLEQAAGDLSGAVETHKYHPMSWYHLGVALKRQGASEAAAEALFRCALCGVTESPELSAGAVLLAAGLYRVDLNQPDKAADLLRKFIKQLDRCAELHLALGVHHGEHDHFVRALALAPGFVPDAQVGRAPGLEEAARTVCEMTDGPVHRLRAVERLTASTAESAKAAGLDNMQSPPAPVNLPPDGADALFLAHDAIPKAVNVITRLTAEIRDACGLRQAAAANAASLLSAARTEAHQAAPAAKRMEKAVKPYAERIWVHGRQRDMTRSKSDQVWQPVSQELRNLAGRLVASGVVANDLHVRVQEARRRFEADEREGDDRFQALRRDLWALLVETARQRAQKAHDNAKAMIGRAEEADRLAAEAAEVLSAAEASTQTAMQIATPPHRLIPFDLPGE